MIRGPRGLRRLYWFVVSAGLALGACGTGGSTTVTSSFTSSSSSTGAVADLVAVRTLLDATAPLRRFTLGNDRIGVWICHVPVGVMDPIYNPVDFRLGLDVDKVTAQLNAYVAAYFTSLSDGLYSPVFVVGGQVTITVDGTNRDCVNNAQKQSPDDITGLVVIADAEHAANQHGGWGRPGTMCRVSERCPARVSGRAAYIGASDLHPDWGAVPAVDLLEHEIGHTLGFPHSGIGNAYTSGIDVMSNSAAPRDANPNRRNASDTLAINRLAAGWLPTASVTVAQMATTVSLSASNRPPNTASGTRLLILPIDDLRFLTVEVLDNSGFDDYLMHPGIVVHEIDQSATACGTGTGSTPCLNESRRQIPLSGNKPFVDLMVSGATWSGQGWSVSVGKVQDGVWTVSVKPSA